MRIALIADTHNDQTSIRQALRHLRAEGIKTVLHAGDITSTQTLRLFKGFDLWIARGNMDRDPLLNHVAHELFGPGRLRQVHRLTFDHRVVGLIHAPNGAQWAELLTTPDTCDVVVHGHTHHTRDVRMDETRIINPGALGGNHWERPKFAILDLITGDLSMITL